MLPLARVPAPGAPPLPGDLWHIEARPRAYVAGAVEAVDRRAAMTFALDPASAASGRTVLEAPVPASYAPPRGEARIAVNLPERVEVEAQADGPALLVVNDQYAFGWSAEVDGRRAEILPTNYLARGVWLEPGAHRVVFRYRTPMLLEGALVAAAAALVLAGWAAARVPRARRGGDEEVRS